MFMSNQNRLKLLVLDDNPNLYPPVHHSYLKPFSTSPPPYISPPSQFPLILVLPAPNARYDTRAASIQGTCALPCVTRHLNSFRSQVARRDKFMRTTDKVRFCDAVTEATLGRLCRLWEMRVGRSVMKKTLYWNDPVGFSGGRKLSLSLRFGGKGLLLRVGIVRYNLHEKQKNSKSNEMRMLTEL